MAEVFIPPEQERSIFILGHFGVARLSTRNTVVPEEKVEKHRLEEGMEVVARGLGVL